MEPTLDFNFSNQELDDEGDRARYAGDAKLLVKFYIRAVHNNTKSVEQGRPIFDDVEYIIIQVPGDRLTNIDAPVTDEYRRRFKKYYEDWKANHNAQSEGTPLQLMPFITPALLAELNAMSIRTLEQLAGMSDLVVSKMMGGNALRQKAVEYLSAYESNAAKADQEAKFKELEAQNAALMERLAALEAAANSKAGEGQVSAAPTAKPATPKESKS